MIIKEYTEYFESIAKGNLAISHDEDQHQAFRAIDIEEVITGVGVDLANMTLFAENPRVTVNDEKSDNPRKIYNGAFLVMEPCTDRTDFKKINAIRSRTEIVSEEILSKILNDAKKFRSIKNYQFAIKGFELNSVTMETVGPILNGWYGWRTSFSINNSFINNLILDASKWHTDKPF